VAWVMKPIVLNARERALGQATVGNQLVVELAGFSAQRRQQKQALKANRVVAAHFGEPNGLERQLSQTLILTQGPAGFDEPERGLGLDGGEVDGSGFNRHGLEHDDRLWHFAGRKERLSDMQSRLERFGGLLHHVVLGQRGASFERGDVGAATENGQGARSAWRSPNRCEIGRGKGITERAELVEPIIETPQAKREHRT